MLNSARADELPEATLDASDLTLAALVNVQLATPFARHWGDVTTSSSERPALS